jgi:elongation factor 1-beta
MTDFKDVSSPAGLKELDNFFARHSYVVGYGPTQADDTLFHRVSSNLSRDQYPHARRWYIHIQSFSPCARTDWPGEKVVAAAAPAAEVKSKKAAPAEETKKPAAEAKKPEAKKPAAAKSDDEDDEPKKKKKPASDDDDDDDDGRIDLDDEGDDEDTKAMFARKKAEIDKIHARQAAKAGDAKSNLTLDIKPVGEETDMAAVEKFVREIQMEGLKWLGSSLVDVVYGIKKLRIMCQLVDVLVSPDTVREAIEVNEEIQSTDVFAFQMA